MDAASFGQNAYFYDAAEGLLTATILLVAEFCAPEKRHIVSVFKVIQELLAPSKKKGKNQFQQLMELLPNEHKAKWFAGAALNTAEQSMASVMSTALSRLNAFLDTELEQLLCFDTEIDAETFCNQKSAIFVIMPEENPNTFFMISLIIQQLYREILAVADENGGKLKNCASGKLLSNDPATGSTYTVAADTAPTQTCNVHKMVRYCKDGKHLATEYCPASSVVEIAALDWNREIIKNIKAQDDEYLLQTLTGKDGELCPVHNKKPSIFPIPGRDDYDDGGSGSWQDWWDKLRP